MITRGIRVRLMAFLVLSAVGIVYVTASYLGFVDKVLGRRLDLHVTLPASAGLYVGSEVTDRGVKIGKVSGMHVIPAGVRVDVQLKQGTKVPLDAPVYVHNLSAVGEQYLDFEPTSTDGPFATEGDTIRGSRQSLPVDESDLLVQLNQLVRSVNRNDLRTVIAELGAMFRDTGHPLQSLIDNGDTFIRTARANQADTVRLLDNGLRVLRTQQRQGDDIRSFARDLADVTGALRRSDGDVRGLVDRGGSSAREIQSMLRELEPTLPVLLANLVTVNQVVTPRLSAVEQLLVTFPRMIASGFTGTPGDGFGHINLQLAGSPQPCRRGYLPPNRWREGDDLTDAPVYHQAHCASGPPYNMRGSKHAPSFPSSDGAGNRSAPFGAQPRAVTVGGLGGEQALFGDDSWKWLLIGPVRAR